MGDQFGSFIGLGIYTIPEAARLTKISKGRIRRWLAGYEYKQNGDRRRLPSILDPQLPTIENQFLLSFLDLIEIRFINAFVEEGMSLQKIRAGAKTAAEILHRGHPFSTKQFKTDGRTIYLLEVVERTGEEWLIDLFSKQYNFKNVIWPSLYKGLEYTEMDDLRRWWPQYPKKRVVIDPRRSFGQPIINNGGVPTVILSDAVKAEGSINRVAKWYGVAREAVEASINFEQGLTA